MKNFILLLGPDSELDKINALLHITSNKNKFQIIEAISFMEKEDSLKESISLLLRSAGTEIIAHTDHDRDELGDVKPNAIIISGKIKEEDLHVFKSHVVDVIDLNLINFELPDWEDKISALCTNIAA